MPTFGKVTNTQSAWKIKILMADSVVFYTMACLDKSNKRFIVQGYKSQQL